MDDPHLVGWWMYVLSLMVIGRSCIVIQVSVLLQEHLFADLAYSQGEHGQHRKFQHILRGSTTLCPWWQRGRMILDLGVAIKSKGGDCWHYGTGLELWHRCCPWWQPSLVTDLSSGTQKVEKDIYAGSSRRRRVYTRVILYKSAYMLVIILLVHGS